MSERVGLIGLGAIGLPLAANFVAKGFEVHGYRRSPMHELQAIGGRPAASPRAIAEACDVIVTVLPTYEDVREVLEGPQGVLQPGRKDLVIIELSTLAMKEKEALRAAVAKAGSAMLDAPLSGVPRMVKDRASIIFASGDKAAYERARPVFDAMTDKSFYLGPFGVGTKMKFAANTLVGIHILATAEAMALGIKAGLDPELMVKVLSPSGGTSLQFQVRAPIMAQRKYEPVLAPHPLIVKDLVKIVQFADELGCPAPLTHVAREYFQRACDSEWRDTDVASIFEIVAQEAGLYGVPAPRTDGVQREIRALEDRRYRAMIDSDVAALETLLGDDLVYTHSTSLVDSKASYLDKLRSRKVVYRKVERPEESIQVHGDTAVITGEVRLEVLVDGSPRAMRSRFTNVWAKRPRGWQMVAWQSTPLPV
jgi:3-hydroxyisobutyrate dehydrogenase-like beta-hydroxyacid dehydrogenase/ketosteroid isomerase-like protein